MCDATVKTSHSFPEGWYIEWDPEVKLFRHFCVSCVEELLPED